jgi:hypothetical protein
LRKAEALVVFLVANQRGRCDQFDGLTRLSEEIAAYPSAQK